MNAPEDYLKKEDYEVRDCPFEDGKSCILKWHYSKACSRTATYFHGLYKKDSPEILGSAMWIPPMKPAAIKNHPHGDWKKVLSLSPDWPSTQTCHKTRLPSS